MTVSDSNSETKTNTTSSKPKCSVCNKRIPLVEELYCKCRCGLMLCSNHRNDSNENTESSHLCTYDYVGESKKILEEQNKQVVKSKVEKI